MIIAQGQAADLPRRSAAKAGAAASFPPTGHRPLPSVLCPLLPSRFSLSPYVAAVLMVERP